MISFKATILKYRKKAEKTGWSYIEIPADIAQQIFPGNKKSFRVKGKLDEYKIEKTSLLPVGEGVFILPINAEMRKGTQKKESAVLHLSLELDKSPLELDGDLLECLAQETEAEKFFFSLPKSHQNYFSKWIQSAKTDATKAKRIAQAVNAACKKMGYAEMIRSQQKERRM